MDKMILLTDEELRTAFNDFGENVGPISPATRYIFEKRLLKLTKLHGVPQEKTKSKGKSTSKMRRGKKTLKKSQSCPNFDVAREDTVYSVSKMPSSQKQRQSKNHTKKEDSVDTGVINNTKTLNRNADCLVSETPLSQKQRRSTNHSKKEDRVDTGVINNTKILNRSTDCLDSETPPSQKQRRSTNRAKKDSVDTEVINNTKTLDHDTDCSESESFLSRKHKQTNCESMNNGKIGSNRMLIKELPVLREMHNTPSGKKVELEKTKYYLQIGKLKMPSDWWFWFRFMLKSASLAAVIYMLHVVENERFKYYNDSSLEQH